MRFKLIYDISPSEWSPHSRQELDSCLRQPPRTSRSEKYTAAVYASYVIGCSVNSRSQLHMSTKHGKWLTSRHVFRINFSFPHHCGIGDFVRCISISHTVTGWFLLDLVKWLTPTREWIQWSSKTSGSGLIRKSGFESGIRYWPWQSLCSECSCWNCSQVWPLECISAPATSIASEQLFSAVGQIYCYFAYFYTNLCFLRMSPPKAPLFFSGSR